MKIRTIIVDDEPWSLRQFEEGLRNTADIDLRGEFCSAEDALSYAKDHEVDFALLDVRMPDMNGITLGRKLRELRHEMILIYVTGYEEFLKAAILDLRADYFLMKPFDDADVLQMIDRVRHLSGRLQKRVAVRTFGEFDIFVDGHLIEFANQKAKELFALCIDSGGEVTMKRSVDLLWEGRDYDDRVKCLYRKAVIYLHSIFREYGVAGVFGSRRGSCHVNREELLCDYYEVLAGKSIRDTSFDGRYMASYSWGEETCGRLCRMAAEYL
ncbi:MAG: response regulator [Blautia sp.]|nr:response regulator [Blautia sp.]MCM1200197.1 response regulator [Bacteroides fragilis]